MDLTDIHSVCPDLGLDVTTLAQRLRAFMDTHSRKRPQVNKYKYYKTYKLLDEKS